MFGSGCSELHPRNYTPLTDATLGQMTKARPCDCPPCQRQRNDRQIAVTRPMIGSRRYWRKETRHPTSRRLQIEYDQTLHKQRHKIANMFGRLKDGRCIAMRDDCCAQPFCSAIRITVAVIFIVNLMSPEPRSFRMNSGCFLFNVIHRYYAEGGYLVRYE